MWMCLKGQATFLTVNRPGFQLHAFCWWKHFITRGHQRFLFQKKTLNCVVFFFFFNLCTPAQHYKCKMFWIAGSKDGRNSCPQELHTKVFKSPWEEWHPGKQSRGYYFSRASFAGWAHCQVLEQPGKVGLNRLHSSVSATDLIIQQSLCQPGAGCKM